jgi:hypothetical protein
MLAGPRFGVSRRKGHREDKSNTGDKCQNPVTPG